MIDTSHIVTFSVTELRELTTLDALHVRAVRLDRWTRDYRRAARSLRIAAERRAREGLRT